MAGNAVKNDFIYIVLVKAHTGLGKVSRVLSGGYEYSHIAVCKDDRFEDFITFSRRRHYAPFDAGFMHETRGCYCFGAHDRVKLRIFRLPVDLRGKRRVYHFLRHVERQQDQYLFNLYSMVTMPVLHGFVIDGAHNCMSFVGKVVELSGAVRLERPYYQYDIRALDTLLAPYLYTERYFSDRSLVQHCANNGEYSTWYLRQYRVVVSQQCHRIDSFLRLVLTQISGTVFQRYLGNAVLGNPLSGGCTSGRGAQMSSGYMDRDVQTPPGYMDSFSQTPPGYMDRVSLWENIRLFLRLNKELLSRIRKGGRDAGCHI